MKNVEVVNILSYKIKVKVIKCYLVGDKVNLFKKILFFVDLS